MKEGGDTVLFKRKIGKGKPPPPYPPIIEPFNNF
jgi:hypothetical protein